MTRAEVIVVGSDPEKVDRILAVLADLDYKAETLEALGEELLQLLVSGRPVFLLDPSPDDFDFLSKNKAGCPNAFYSVHSGDKLQDIDELPTELISDFISLSADDAFLAERMKWILLRAKSGDNYSEISEELEKSKANAWAVLDTIIDGIITINDRGDIASLNSAAEGMFGYKESELLGENIKILMPQPYRREHDSYIENYQETGHKKIIGIGREVVGVRKNGNTFPMELAVSEVNVHGKRTYTGVVRDISLRRELERELVNKSEIERRAIGRDLHDGLGQVLTAISLISKNIATRLQKIDAGLADDVLDIVSRVKTADHHLRLLVKGLVPVEFGKRGIVDALERLASDVERVSGVPCSFKVFGETSVPIENSTATHLFRIVQEASNNAVRHSGASAIGIIVALGQERIRLRVTDNGKGFHVKDTRSLGLGMHTMAQRAQLIGASFDIQSNQQEGTTITCTLRIDSTKAKIDHEL